MNTWKSVTGFPGSWYSWYTNQQSISIDQINQLISDSKTGFLKDAKEEAKNLVRDEIQTDKASMITVFGLFASIISFLTIEFQFLKTICDSEIILSFTFILFGILIFFNLALDSLVSKRELKWDWLRIILLVVTICFVGIWVVLYNFSEKRSCDYVDNSRFEQLESKTQKQNDKFQEKIDQSLEQQNTRILDWIYSQDKRTPTPQK